jgi:histidinol-phosphate aminotransferase
MELEMLVRKNILNLIPYTSARDNYQDGIFLDANENSLGSVVESDVNDLNRYPDPHQKLLRNILSEYLRIDMAKLIFGVGSDQIIDLVIRVFCEPGVSNVIIPQPTYGVFKVACNINNVEVRECKLDSDFDIDIESILKLVNNQTRIIFLCSPNNPTGNLFGEEKVKLLADIFNGIIFIDEAYIEFSRKKSFLSELDKYKNIIISRTFSKAWGLAGVRCGYCLADEFIIRLLFKVKDPYSISRPTEHVILQALKNSERKEKYVSKILQEKEKLISQLKLFDFILKIFPSNANFILVKMKNADEVYNHLNQKAIRVRMRKDDERLVDCLRITVGNSKENDLLINALEELK